MGNELKQEWLEIAIQWVEESDIELTLGDKSIIRGCLDAFFQDFTAAQNKEPDLAYSNMRVLYYSYINKFGYIMPKVETMEERY